MPSIKRESTAESKVIVGEASFGSGAALDAHRDGHSSASRDGNPDAMFDDALSARRPRRALINRFVDFWLLGGLSLLVLAALLAFDIHYAYLLVAAPLLRIAIDYPHFISSYKIAYSRDRAFFRKFWLQLAAAPLAIAGLIAVCLVSPPSTRQTITAGMVGVLYFVFGWHRTRQVYGCMIVYSIYDRYRLAVWQKAILKSLLHSIWIAGYVNIMAFPSAVPFYDFLIPQWSVPRALLIASDAWLAASFFAFLAGVIGHKAYSERRLPSVNFLVSLVAVFFWSVSYLIHRDFFFLMTPTFHSLQHLGFVYAYEKNARPPLRNVALFVVLLLAGYLVFVWSPRELASFVGPTIALTTLFASLHHYLLDSVIWRTSDPKMVGSLLD